MTIQERRNMKSGNRFGELRLPSRSFCPDIREIQDPALPRGSGSRNSHSQDDFVQLVETSHVDPWDCIDVLKKDTNGSNNRPLASSPQTLSPGSPVELRQMNGSSLDGNSNNTGIHRILSNLMKQDSVVPK
jgi:hypothetical protein